VDSGSGQGKEDRRTICQAITEGGVVTADLDLLRQSARQMLIAVLSCRDNRSQSGPFARIAGDAIGASHRLPNMATEAFLSCLSRTALETAARDAGVNIAPRAKDTRSRLVSHFQEATFVYPGALFRLTASEQRALAERAETGPGWGDPLDTGADEEDGDPNSDPDARGETGDTAGADEERAEQEAA
jgi:ParB family chromosome partitioning protein